METMPLVPSLRRGTENMKGVADVTVVLDVAHNEPAIKSLGDKVNVSTIVILGGRIGDGTGKEGSVAMGPYVAGLYP